jgi:predicted nucleic acid-binding protein
VIDLSPLVIERALVALEDHPLRALDALQIASSLLFAPDLFITADHRQCEAARASGLRVEEI